MDLEPGQQFADRLRRGGRVYDQIGASVPGEGCSGVLGTAVDVVVGAQTFRVLGTCHAAGDSGGVVAEPSRELDREVPEAAEAEHGDPPAGLDPGSTDGVEDRYAGAAERRGFEEVQTIGDPGESVGRHRDGLGPASGIGHARDPPIRAMDDVAGPAELAVPTTAAEPAHSDTVTNRPPLDPVAELGDYARDLMPWSDGEPRAWVVGCCRCDIGIAHPASRDPHTDPGARRPRNLHPRREQLASRLVHDDGGSSHWHGSSPFRGGGAPGLPS